MNDEQTANFMELFERLTIAVEQINERESEKWIIKYSKIKIKKQKGE